MSPTKCPLQSKLIDSKCPIMFVQEYRNPRSDNVLNPIITHPENRSFDALDSSHPKMLGL